MSSLISLLIIVTLSLITTRIATVALVLTGLSRDAAHFQALSAFSGVGYTTREAEYVVDNAARRRIISIVMLLGNIGFVTVVASLLLAFTEVDSLRVQAIRLSIILIGLGILWYLYTNNLIETYTSDFIRRVLQQWTNIEVHDYASLLSLSEGYGVSEVNISTDSWMADQHITEAGLADEGLLVLGIYREDGDYIGAPQGDTKINSGDRLIIYGDTETLEDLGARLKGISGNTDHQEGVARHKKRVQQQKAQDSDYSD